ncbi:MAG: DnaJ domain [Bacteriovoracaceae bacterium]|nr:DnaJ domain [Bacteriovoracaceae bacterium]
MNFFKILDLPSRLNLNLKELEEKFYKASLKNHPDKNQGIAEATLRSAEINEAYRTLKDKWKRAAYVLLSKGQSLDSKLPPSMAEIYFEAQEVEDSQALVELEKRLVKEDLAREERLQKSFEEFDTATDPLSTLEEMKTLVIEHKYASSMLRDLRTKLSK